MGLPDKLWLRRGEVIAGLGITEEMFGKLLAANVVRAKYFPGCKRAYFLRAEVLKIQPEDREGKGTKK